MGYRAAAALLAAALASCAGNGAGLDANGNPITPGGGDTGALTADFQSIQDHVFTPICTRCHAGAGAPEGLQLDSDHSYALLVGVPSTEQPNVLRVSPGNPDSSYLVQKLQGSSGISGQRMPFGGPYLPQSTIDVIRQWISDGALQSPAAMVAATVKSGKHLGVTMTSPDDAAIVSAVLPNIVVAFSADVDSSTVNTTTVDLQRIEGLSSSPAPIPIAIATPAGNPSALLISPRTPLASGTYRMTLHGALADMNANALGNDHSFTFTVDSSQ
ncbi:MAG TPA: Ig-like domain-containing protein [Steroidobacteraceae bacterium]|nr:Ig-like domain-containing protein [Steroidobacteraceae bacterium]